MHTSLSPTSACLYAALASCAAFIAGRATSIYYIGSASTRTRTAPAAGGFIVKPSQGANTVNSFMFPSPELITGKEAPKTKYTSMVSSNVLSSTAGYATLHLDAESSLNDIEEVCIQTDDGHSKCSIDGFNEEDYEAAFQQMEEEANANANASNDEDEEHFPAGQHLLIDMERVNSEFLNDEVSLAKAMVDVIHKSKLTLLSYHCHKLIPMGVSCVGVLLESHISFHTWPEAGVITLDLFTCGDGELVPVLPSIKRLFAIPQDGASDTFNEQPRIVWNHKLRGFRKDYAKTDLMDYVLEASDYDLKEEIASAQTPFQHIDVYDVIDQNSGKYNGYEKSLLGDDTYETKNPLLFSPNRIVFLDEVMQSQRFGNEAYHETLVHPAMFLHPDPKRVAIIGGGEGATLREVLKHNTVDKVKMIEIDEMMVQVSREFLPDWNNCTDLVDSAEWCGDDERADIHYADAFGWFNDRFATGVEEKIEEQFDVLIMDALDPEDDIPFAEMLYSDKEFVQTLSNSLTDDGVIVLQLGEAPSYKNPAEQFTKSSRRQLLIKLLEDVGFEEMHFYEDGNCRFEAPWTFLVAAKGADASGRWYMSNAAVDIDIHERTVHTVSGKPALKYFDSSVMNHYHYPHKAFEIAYCRSLPTPDSCYDDNSPRSNIPASEFEVRMSGIGDGSGRGVFTTVDIKKGSSIARKESAHPVHFPPAATTLIRRYMNQSKDISSVMSYAHGYGWETHIFGGFEYFVESTIFTFSNHGCNGTFNTIDYPPGEWEEDIVSEQNATLSDLLHALDTYVPVFDIFAARHKLNFNFYARTDVKAGAEIFSDYLFLVTEQNAWLKETDLLKRVCRGEAVGDITANEERSKVE